MIKRKLYKYLLDWKNNPNKKPLILRGARQVGKTTLIDDFGKEYKNYLKLNLEKDKDAKIFERFGNDVNKIVDYIELEYEVNLTSSDSLLFIDEIQAQPQAIPALRYFYEDLKNLHVIAAGSLLEFSLGEVKSFPVGRVQQIALHPLSFEEFLEAAGEKKALSYYQSIPVSPIAHDKLLMLYNLYILIGGMPEVVNTYLNNEKSLASLRPIYSTIWDNYLDDVEKYGKNTSEKKILRHVINTAPYVRDRITYNGFGQSNYGSREVSEAFDKLEKAQLILRIFPTTETKLPIIPNLKRKPKIQILDTGLLNFASNIQHQFLQINDLSNLYRGYIVNHILFQELIAQTHHIHSKPTFWVRENTSANAEIDLVFVFEKLVIPIEIKSGAKGSLRSLHEFMDRVDHTFAIRLLANQFSIEKVKTIKGKEFSLINLPYYCIGKIEEWIKYVVQHAV